MTLCDEGPRDRAYRGGSAGGAPRLRNHPTIPRVFQQKNLIECEIYPDSLDFSIEAQELWEH